MSRNTPRNIGASRPAATPAAKTVTRNTAIPRPQQATQQRTVTHDMIAKRAYEIYASGKGGSQTENWLRAERELRTGR